MREVIVTRLFFDIVLVYDLIGNRCKVLTPSAASEISLMLSVFFIMQFGLSVG